MLHQGKLVLCGPLDEIKAQHRRITLRFDTQQPKPSQIPGALTVTGTGREWTVICNASQVNPSAIAATLGAKLMDQEAASLNEIFVGHAGVFTDDSRGLNSCIQQLLRLPGESGGENTD